MEATVERFGDLSEAKRRSTSLTSREILRVCAAKLCFAWFSKVLTNYVKCSL